MIRKEFAVKNMLSQSAVRLLQLYFEVNPVIKLLHVSLGKIIIEYNPNEISLFEINEHFKTNGFELINDKNLEIVEKTKAAAIELICLANNVNSLVRNSDYISEKLQLPYAKISKTFNQVTGITLEKYIILVKIERVKELIVQNELSLSEISYIMGYSSVQYLSNQFKSVCGATVGEFKKDPGTFRKTLESLLST